MTPTAGGSSSRQAAAAAAAAAGVGLATPACCASDGAFANDAVLLRTNRRRAPACRRAAPNPSPPCTPSQCTSAALPWARAYRPSTSVCLPRRLRPRRAAQRIYAQSDCRRAELRSSTAATPLAPGAAPRCSRRAASLRSCGARRAAVRNFILFPVRQQQRRGGTHVGTVQPVGHGGTPACVMA